MVVDYWHKHYSELREELEEIYDFVCFALTTVSDENYITDEIDNQDISHLKTIITHFGFKGEVISNDKEEYKSLFDFNETIIDEGNFSLWESLHLINLMGIEVLKHSLYKVKDKEMAMNFLNMSTMRFSIERFKENFVAMLNAGSFTDEDNIRDFHYIWDLEFRKDIMINGNDLPIYNM